MAWTRWISVATLISSLALVGTACSSSSTGVAGGGGGDCATYASVTCDKLESCAPFAITMSYGTVAACKARFTTLCQTGSQEPGIGNFSAFISTCSAAYASASCDAIFSPVQGCSPPVGTFANGAACGDDAQCSSLFCSKAAGATCGTCAPTPKAGDACTGTCGVALTCTSGKCAAQVAGGALGATCSNTAPCATTLTCFSGTCAKPLGVGEACGTTTAACDALTGLTCTGGKCAAIQTADAGQACGLSGTSYVTCTAGATCKTASGTSSGTCVAPVADGQACDATTGANCMQGASCVGGKCTVDPASTCK